ncbi:hypothetical protein [Marinobacter salarius]|uniref:hypothetical protein n=1 Tax=Marinobacter salarius TaxID=1420917 RepID=UPI0032EE379F
MPALKAAERPDVFRFKTVFPFMKAFQPLAKAVDDGQCHIWSGDRVVAGLVLVAVTSGSARTESRSILSI